MNQLKQNWKGEADTESWKALFVETPSPVRGGKWSIRVCAGMAEERWKSVWLQSLGSPPPMFDPVFRSAGCPRTAQRAKATIRALALRRGQNGFHKLRTIGKGAHTCRKTQKCTCGRSSYMYSAQNIQRTRILPLFYLLQYSIDISPFSLLSLSLKFYILVQKVLNA